MLTAARLVAGSIHCRHLRRTDANLELPERFGVRSHCAAAQVQSIASLGPGVSVGVFLGSFEKV